MKRRIIYLVAITIVWLSSCDSKEEVVPQQLDCANFTSMLVKGDFQMVKTETAKFLDPNNTSSSHQEHLSKLISALDKCPGLKVIDTCFECIETNPVTSEIRIQITHNNLVMMKALDFRYSDNAFVLVNIHD